MQAGGLAGTAVDLSLYPIDTLKTRLQSSAGFTKSGGFSGVYKGVGSAVVGSAPGAAFFFASYEATKAWLRTQQSGACDEKEEESKKYNGYARDSINHMAAASIGEVAACAVRVPTEVVKQRAQASQHASSMEGLKYILSLRHTHGFNTMWRELYRGWSVTIIREVPFTVIQFPLWEAMKKWQCHRSGNIEASASESALFGCVSGGVAAILTTPLDVLKTRMMLAEGSISLKRLTRQIWHEAGFRVFFAGVGPRTAWISAGGAIFLGSYQWAWNRLGLKY